MLITERVYYLDYSNIQKTKTHNIKHTKECILFFRCNKKLITVGIWNPNGSGFRIVKNKLVCKWSWDWIWSEIQKLKHLNTNKDSSHLVTIWNSDCLVWVLNDPAFRWSGLKLYQQLKPSHAWPFENWTIWYPSLKKSTFWAIPDFEWSDFHCIQIPKKLPSRYNKQLSVKVLGP